MEMWRDGWLPAARQPAKTSSVYSLGASDSLSGLWRANNCNKWPTDAGFYLTCHVKQSSAPHPFNTQQKQTENALIHLSEYNDEPGDLQTERERERGEKVGQKGGVTVCDSHREDQLLNPCTISTDSLFSDLEALKICILVM